MDRLALFFAKRYLLSKKSINAINIISGISLVGVLVSSAALVSILSFYNGLEKLILGQFNSVISEIRIEPAQGKKINYSDEYHQLWNELKQDPRVVRFEETLEGQVLLRREDHQVVGHLKGVSNDYLEWWASDTVLYNAAFTLYEQGKFYAVMGSKLDYELDIPYERAHSQVAVYSPRPGVVNAINPAEEFNVMNIEVSGVMGRHESLDESLLVPIEFARLLLDEHSAISAIEVDLKEDVSLSRFIAEWKPKLGDSVNLLSPEQQNSSLYRIIKSEKWAIFAILTFTGFIAILNIIASLTMLVIDKRKDIAVLKGIGASPVLIRRIFFYQGMLISLAGCLSGLLIGFLLAWTQQQWGWLRFSQTENLLVEAYPVDIRLTDFVLVFCTVFLVSLLIANVSSRLSLRQHMRLS